MFKNLLFYTVASTVAGGVAQLLGANLVVVLMTSLIVPPMILLGIAVARYNNWI